MNLIPINAFATASEGVNLVHNTMTDEAGNVLETVTRETEDTYIVDLYINGELDNTVTTDKETWAATMVSYGSSDLIEEAFVTTYDLHEYIQIPNQDLDTPTVYSNIDASTSYSIERNFNTDYLYQSKILVANTKTAAYETSTNNRHNETILNFSQGDAISLVVSAIIAGFGGSLGIAVVVALGIPVVAGKLADGLTRSVWMTDFRVSTKVYFNNIYTGLISKTYDRVLVSEMTANNKKYTYYADDLYGYDIVWSNANTAASGCAVAFVDKYITQFNPDLKLPITSLPYNG